jgi:hypothetical protein
MSFRPSKLIAEDDQLARGGTCFSFSKKTAGSSTTRWIRGRIDLFRWEWHYWDDNAARLEAMPFQNSK